MTQGTKPVYGMSPPDGHGKSRFEPSELGYLSLFRISDFVLRALDIDAGQANRYTAFFGG